MAGPRSMPIFTDTSRDRLGMLQQQPGHLVCMGAPSPGPPGFLPFQHPLFPQRLPQRFDGDDDDMGPFGGGGMHSPFRVAAAQHHHERVLAAAALRRHGMNPGQEPLPPLLPNAFIHPGPGPGLRPGPLDWEGGERVRGPDGVGRLRHQQPLVGLPRGGEFRGISRNRFPSKMSLKDAVDDVQQPEFLHSHGLHSHAVTPTFDEARGQMPRAFQHTSEAPPPPHLLDRPPGFEVLKPPGVELPEPPGMELLNPSGFEHSNPPGFEHPNPPCFEHSNTRGFEHSNPPGVELSNPTSFEVVPNPPGFEILNPPGFEIPNPPDFDIPNPPGFDIPNPPGFEIPNPPGFKIPNPPGYELPPGFGLPNPSGLSGDQISKKLEGGQADKVPKYQRENMPKKRTIDEDEGGLERRKIARLNNSGHESAPLAKKSFSKVVKQVDSTPTTESKPECVKQGKDADDEPEEGQVTPPTSPAKVQEHRDEFGGRQFKEQRLKFSSSRTDFAGLEDGLALKNHNDNDFSSIVKPAPKARPASARNDAPVKLDKFQKSVRENGPTTVDKFRTSTRESGLMKVDKFRRFASSRELSLSDRENFSSLRYRDKERGLPRIEGEAVTCVESFSSGLPSVQRKGLRGDSVDFRPSKSVEGDCDSSKYRTERDYNDSNYKGERDYDGLKFSRSRTLEVRRDFSPPAHSRSSRFGSMRVDSPSMDRVSSNPTRRLQPQRSSENEDRLSGEMTVSIPRRGLRTVTVDDSRDGSVDRGASPSSIGKERKLSKRFRVITDHLNSGVLGRDRPGVSKRRGYDGQSPTTFRDKSLPSDIQEGEKSPLQKKQKASLTSQERGSTSSLQVKRENLALTDRYESESEPEQEPRRHPAIFARLSGFERSPPSLRMPDTSRQDDHRFSTSGRSLPVVERKSPSLPRRISSFKTTQGSMPNLKSIPASTRTPESIYDEERRDNSFVARRVSLEGASTKLDFQDRLDSQDRRGFVKETSNLKREDLSSKRRLELPGGGRAHLSRDLSDGGRAHLSRELSEGGRAHLSRSVSSTFSTGMEILSKDLFDSKFSDFSVPSKPDPGRLHSRGTLAFREPRTQSQFFAEGKVVKPLPKIISTGHKKDHLSFKGCGRLEQAEDPPPRDAALAEEHGQQNWDAETCTAEAAKHGKKHWTSSSISGRRSSSPGAVHHNILRIPRSAGGADSSEAVVQHIPLRCKGSTLPSSVATAAESPYNVTNCNSLDQLKPLTTLPWTVSSATDELGTAPMSPPPSVTVPPGKAVLLFGANLNAPVSERRDTPPVNCFEADEVDIVHHIKSLDRVTPDFNNAIDFLGEKEKDADVQGLQQRHLFSALPSVLEARAQSVEGRGQSDEARGQSDEARDQSDEARDQSVEARDQSVEARDQSVEARDQSVDVLIRARDQSVDVLVLPEPHLRNPDVVRARSSEGGNRKADVPKTSRNGHGDVADSAKNVEEHEIVDFQPTLKHKNQDVNAPMMASEATEQLIEDKAPAVAEKMYSAIDKLKVVDETNRAAVTNAQVPLEPRNETTSQAAFSKELDETSQDVDASNNLEEKKSFTAAEQVQVSAKKDRVVLCEPNGLEGSVREVGSGRDVETGRDVESSRDVETGRDVETNCDVETGRDVETSLDVETVHDVETGRDVETGCDGETPVTPAFGNTRVSVGLDQVAVKRDVTTVHTVLMSDSAATVTDELEKDNMLSAPRAEDAKPVMHLKGQSEIEGKSSSFHTIVGPKTRPLETESSSVPVQLEESTSVQKDVGSASISRGRQIVPSHGTGPHTWRRGRGTASSSVPNPANTFKASVQGGAALVPVVQKLIPPPSYVRKGNSLVRASGLSNVRSTSEGKPIATFQSGQVRPVATQLHPTKRVVHRSTFVAEPSNTLSSYHAVHKRYVAPSGGSDVSLTTSAISAANVPDASKNRDDVGSSSASVVPSTAAAVMQNVVSTTVESSSAHKIPEKEQLSAGSRHSSAGFLDSEKVRVIEKPDDSGSGIGVTVAIKDKSSVGQIPAVTHVLGKTVHSVPQNDVVGSRLYVRRNANQLIVAAPPPAAGVVQTKTESNQTGRAMSIAGHYFKRKTNQLVRKYSGKGSIQSVVQGLLGRNSPKVRHEQGDETTLVSRKMTLEAMVESKKGSLGRSSWVWTLNGAAVTRARDFFSPSLKGGPRLFPWKRQNSIKTLKSQRLSRSLPEGNKRSLLFLLSKGLRRVRPVQPVYTRSADGFSLHRSGVMSLGGGNLKWTKSLERRAKQASEDVTKAVAEAERRKREFKDVAGDAASALDDGRRVTRKGLRGGGERIVWVGMERYKMDASSKTLQRIPGSQGGVGDDAAILPGDAKVPPILTPRRSVIGGTAYLRVGNGNQLVRDPKASSRALASEKVRWSLHNARFRRAKKQQYCQFFTRFGKCNKETGKCPYIHDPDKVAVCTKFLNGSCGSNTCLLTHKVIPERMPDCSYFLKGLCTHENCPYRHVSVNPKAPYCDGFLRGYCNDGDKCNKKHTYVCATYVETGECSNQASCRFHHPKKTRTASDQILATTRKVGTKRKRRYFSLEDEPLAIKPLGTVVMSRHSSSAADHVMAADDGSMEFISLGDSDADEDQKEFGQPEPWQKPMPLVNATKEESIMIEEVEKRIKPTFLLRLSQAATVH